MKLAIETLIHEMEGKLGGYVTLLVYRYANLCIKAQPMSLLSVLVDDDEQGQMKIEEVAGLTMPDEYHLKLTPYDKRFTFPLCKAVKVEHPEFKQDLIKPDNADDDEERVLILTMPEVNDDRHDELTDAVGVLYDGCKAQIDKTVASYKVKLEPKITPMTSDEHDEAQNAFDSSVKTHTDLIEKVKADKLQEIEEAYQHWLADQTAKQTAADEKAAARGENAGQEFRINEEDE